MSAPETKKAPADQHVSDKRAEKASIVELKNGKVGFKQKPLSFEKQSETLQEIVTFRGMLEDRINAQHPPLTTFPEAHKPLIAKLGHESDKTLAMLTKHVHHELLPTLDEDDEDASAVVTSAALPLNTVENAIKSVLTRNNYGIDAPLGVRLPAAVCVWRWEVKNEYMDWLPKNSKEKAEARRAERAQAKEELRLMFEALSQEARDSIIDPKKTVNKLPTKELNRAETTPNPEVKVDDVKATPESSKKQGKKKAVEAENEQQTETPKSAARTKKAQDPEKVAKEKERLEKKNARLEKEKRQKDAQNKAQSMMAKFVLNPKAPLKSPETQETAVAGPSKTQSDFERMFRPFVLQKDKVMAPQNWFLAEEKRRRKMTSLGPNTEVIVLDSDDDADIKMLEPQPTEQELSVMPLRERLRCVLSNLLPSTSSSLSHIRNPPGFKIHHPVSMRDLMTQLSEAEISGNDDLVREILARVSDRDLFPAKAFSFHDDARPGYFGTWTRSSRIIGPRTPFAKDTLVFDYGYDSGEEWEEEPVGEDVVEDGEEEDVDVDEADSDADSWLIDDDEESDLTALGRGNSPPPLLDLPTFSASKRKAEDGEQKMGKKRKVVIPLVPFAKGPIWESTIGQIEYEPFKPYAIQLFNDTPMSIDPFTFVSNCLEEYKASQTSQRNAAATALANNTTDGGFVVPALPPRLTGATSAVVPIVSSPQNLGGSTAAKKAPAILKSVFPEVHMQFLLNKINQLQASSITALVETIYQELREHKVKKNSIEAKIREVGEKCNVKRVWVVKPALMQTQVS